jgi:diguanylate cyclase (GGDEF)-like protein/PAS domain S-box-containing protein
METPHQPDAIRSPEILTDTQQLLEQQLNAVQSIAQVGVWVFQIPSNQLIWSDETCRILGIDSKNFKGDIDTYLSAVHPDDRQTVLNAIERTKQEQAPPDLDHRIVHPDGDVRDIHVRGQLFHDPAGNALVSGTVQDVTEKKQSKGALRTMSDRLVNTLESMTDAFYTLDKDWRFTYLNKEAERLLQRPRTELLGKVIWKEFKDLIGTTFEYEFRRAVSQNRAASFEEIYVPFNSWKELRIFPSDEGLAVYFTEISERKRLQEMQRQSEERFKVVARATTDIIWDWDTRADRIWWNEGIQSLFGYSPEDFDGGFQSWASRIHPEERDRVLHNFYAAMQGPQEKWSDEYRIMRKDGSYADVQDHGFFIRDPNGKVVRMIGSMVDITERKQTEFERQEAETRSRAQASLLDKAQDAITVSGIDNRISFWNKGAERLFGWTAEEAIGRTKEELIIVDLDQFNEAHNTVLQQGDWSGEIRKRRKDGSTLMVEAHWTLVRDDNEKPQSILGIDTDITQRKEAERAIEDLAFFDPLTRLPNRRLLLDRLQHALATSRRTRHTGALLFIDLDNFKSLNDTLGHDKGDALLQQVAWRLETCVSRKSDTVARLGGDEFVIMLEDLSEGPEEAAAQAEIVAEKILAAFKRPFQLDGHEHHTTPSIGVTLFDNRIRNVDELLKRADLAMYQAKAAGRNTVRFFDPDMQTVVSARVELETDLRQGLLKHEFSLHYQRQTNSNGYTIGAEALIRWHHPRRGMLSPALFIPLAEETGLILHLGQWVLETACRQLTIWAAKPQTSHLTVAVNVSARQFRQPDFVEQVLAVLDHTGANPKSLKLELTESLLVANVENTVAKMTALKAKGVGFALDDFGTGYSSLSYLKRLPLDQLKIDQSFVRDVLTDPNDAAIARTIVALGQTLGLDVIAEGVETKDQRDFLAENGCHAYQGYFFSAPLPAERF